MITVKRPTLIIDESIVRNNISRMMKKADASGVTLRPHFKTHHSADIGEWYHDAGVQKITVSSVSMAQYFAAHGWKDITIAFPYNWLEIDEINELSSKIKLNLLLESAESLAHLDQHTRFPMDFYIKIDVGSHRTGLEPHQIDIIQKLSEGTDKLTCNGLLAHAGHTYRARGESAIEEIHSPALQTILDLKQIIGRNDLKISYGDTPSGSQIDDWSMVDEMRPGNFVYYDLMQAQIGSCTLDDIGVALACPIVAKHISRNEIVIYGGAVHLSKDRIRSGEREIYGQPVIFHEDKWEILEGTWVDRLSQEHGILKAEDDRLDKLKVGDVVGILPVHSCLVADMMTAQQTFEGKKIEKMPKI
jgi:D-serine deaminase-like pyridoxal phosphate-dependent protein